jgi:integration host factor subunit alpha
LDFHIVENRPNFTHNPESLFESAGCSHSSVDHLWRILLVLKHINISSWLEFMPSGGKTLTRADLAEAVFQKVGLPRNESAELVESVLKEIISCLEKGDNVKLSSFGSFGVRDKRERVGRNPKTGDVVPITPRRVLIFRASNIMKERVNSSLVNSKKAAE